MGRSNDAVRKVRINAMNDHYCAHCGVSLGSCDAYFDLRQGPVCLRCVVAHEIPLEFTGRKTEPGEPVLWSQQRIQRSLDRLMPMRPLLAPEEVYFPK